jgi:hypothetical protein
MTSSEVKLDILANTVRDMMQRISRKDELVVQRPHVPIVPEQTRIHVPKHFAVHPWYHGLDNDSFMYSIHNTVEDEVQNQKMEEYSPDMICMFNCISSMDDSPKLDWYNDDYTTLDFSKKSATYDWEEEDHLQSQQDNQSIHGNYDINDQSAENLRVSGNTLPLCFSSFQFLKRNSRQVVNSEDGKFSDESVKDVIDDMGSILDPKSQSIISLDFQSPDGSTELETIFESVECNSVPLDYNSFQILKETLEQALKDKHIKSEEISFESMHQSCQSFQDPIVDRLDDLCGQNHSSFASHELKSCYDFDMVKQSTSQSSSATVLLLNLSEQLQPYQRLHEDTNNIDTVPDHVTHLDESKNQGTGHFYVDTIATYMEKFFTTEPQSISGITFVFQDG